MARLADRTLHMLDQGRHELGDRFSGPLADLREEIASLVASLSRNGGKGLHNAQHQMEDIADAARQHLPVLAHQAGRQARHMGKALRHDPVPALVMVGTVALLASLVFHENRR